MLYLEQMKEDIRNAIKWNFDRNDWIDSRDELEEKLNDELWIDDSVTGNASGSYYCNSLESREQVLDDGMEFLSDACSNFGIDAEEIGKHFIDEDWEWFDVTIRCYLLSQVIAKVLDDLEEDG